MFLKISFSKRICGILLVEINCENPNTNRQKTCINQNLWSIWPQNLSKPHISHRHSSFLYLKVEREGYSLKGEPLMNWGASGREFVMRFFLANLLVSFFSRWNVCIKFVFSRFCPSLPLDHLWFVPYSNHSYSTLNTESQHVRGSMGEIDPWFLF